MPPRVLAAHADWSVDQRKRWITVARPEAGGWRVDAPQPVGDPATLVDRLRREADGAPVALGVDLPLGLPRAFAGELPDADFPAFLRALDTRPGFLDVCDTLDLVSRNRPFYPRRGIAGMTRAEHAAALGFAGPEALSRACDRATAERPAGAPLFWTLGANQSGKAAIAAWRDMVIPAVRSDALVRLWPFDGSFRALLTPGAVAIAETYPAEAMRHLKVKLSGSKRRQADRAMAGPALRAAMDRLGTIPEPAMRRAAADGFGSDAAGEDRFDSTLGLLCVLGVMRGHRTDAAPDDPWITKWEGWVLGQTALPRSAWWAEAGPPKLDSSKGDSPAIREDGLC